MPKDYLQYPHSDRPPSNEVVHAATVRYVEWGRKNGINPSPEWDEANPKPTSAKSPRAAKGKNGLRR